VRWNPYAAAGEKCEREKEEKQKRQVEEKAEEDRIKAR
jgi:hypothetical protein